MSTTIKPRAGFVMEFLATVFIRVNKTPFLETDPLSDTSSMAEGCGIWPWAFTPMFCALSDMKEQIAARAKMFFIP